MRRYPGCFASGPGWQQQGEQRLRLRIDQPKAFQFICEGVWKATQVLTKNDDPFPILLPLLYNLLVHVLCGLGVYGEDRPKAVPKIGHSAQWRVRRRHLITSEAVYYYR